MEKKSSLPIKIYRNKIESRITIKIKVGYYPKLLTPETMKLLGITKSKITKNENSVNVPLLEITKVVLIHGNVVNNIINKIQEFVYTRQLLDTSPENFIFLKTFDSEFSHINLWFKDRNSKPLEIEDKINITLVLIKV